MTTDTVERPSLRPSEPTDDTAPDDDWDTLLVGELAGAVREVERARERVRVLTEQDARRAESCWELDRRTAAEELGAGVGRSPERVVARLRRTVQGCVWLIARWDALLRIAEQSPKGWDAPQRRYAGHLLGLPTRLHASAPWAASDDPAVMVDTARRVINELERDRKALVHVDACEQMAAADGFFAAPSPGLALARREQSAAVRYLRWLRTQLDALRRPAPAPPAAVAPTPIGPKPLSAAANPEPLPALSASGLASARRIEEAVWNKFMTGPWPGIDADRTAGDTGPEPGRAAPHRFEPTEGPRV